MLRITTKQKNLSFGTRAMTSAIQRGNLAEVKYMIDSDNCGLAYCRDISLCCALQFCRKEIVILLLAKGANVNGRVGRPSDFSEHPTPLHLAVRHCDTEILELLLQKGALLDVVAGSRGTPLCEAVRRNKVEMIEILLKHGADVNIPDSMGQTPVMFAAENPDVHVIKMLLDHGADPSTALYHAAEKGRLETVQLLLSKGANINYRNPELDVTPLHGATENCHGQLVDFLLKEGADINAQDCSNKSVLSRAVETRCLTIVNIILRHRPNINLKTNQNAVHIAFGFLDETNKESELLVYGEIVQKLLSHGFTIDDKDATNPKFLFVAIRNGHVRTVRELVKCESNLKMLRNSVLSDVLPLYPGTLSNQERLSNVLVINFGAHDNVAMGRKPKKRSICRNIDLDMFKLLLTDKSAVESNHLLNVAVWQGYEDITKCLLSYGVNVNAPDSSGRAPLHFCVLRSNNMLCPISQRNHTSVKVEIGIVKLLVSSGADVNVTTKTGETPLLIGAENKLFHIVQVLVDLNADVNGGDEHGTTALHHTAHNGDLQMCEYLLTKGAKVNARGKDDMTPLHVASERGHLELVQSLLENGADVDADSKKGTALHIACLEGRCDVVKFLLEFGADVNVISSGGDTAAAKMIRRRSGEGGSPNFLDSYFFRHLYKMRTANLFLNEKNLLCLASVLPEELRGFGQGARFSLSALNVPVNFVTSCDDETTVMKREKIGDSNFTYYDVLIGNNARLVKLSANQSLNQVVNSSEFEKKFPNYAGLIKRRFQKGKWMRELRENCSEIFLSIAPHLPVLCVERILAFLPVSDMRMLVNAWQCSLIQDKVDVEFRLSLPAR